MVVFAAVMTILGRRRGGRAATPGYRSSSMPEDPQCPACGGSGKTKQAANATFGAGSVILPAVCPTCRGSGHVRPDAAA